MDKKRINMIEFVISLLLLFCSTLTIAQNEKPSYDDYQSNLILVDIVSDTNMVAGDYTIGIDWETYYSFPDDILFTKSNYKYFYPGICKLTVSKGDDTLFTKHNLGNPLALDYVAFWFYDFDKDGNLDFRYASENSGKSLMYYYYLFNPRKNTFIHKKDWDFLTDWDYYKTKI